MLTGIDQKHTTPANTTVWARQPCLDKFVHVFLRKNGHNQFTLKIQF